MIGRAPLPGWRRVFRWLPSLHRVDRDVDEELRFHLESRQRALEAAGHSVDEARQIAAKEFGDLDASRAELIEVDRRMLVRERRAGFVDALRHDVLHGLRSLSRRPAFAAGVVTTLALAVGANAAVFSVIDPLLFRAPPGVVDPARVVRLYGNSPKSPRAVNGRAVARYFSYPAFLSMRAGLAGVATVAAFRAFDSSGVMRGNDSVFANVTYATADFLPMLGVRPSRGRFFTSAEDDVDSPAPVCALSSRFARRLFGGADQSLGQTLRVRGQICTVIGVVAGDFQGITASATDMWAPFSGQPRFPNGRTIAWYRTQDTYIPIVARIHAGANARMLAARATVTLARSLDQPRPMYEGRTVITGPILEGRGPLDETQEIAIGTRLAVVAGLLLLIACANVANLYLVLAVRRRRETAVRLALGISRARLAAQFVIEGATLAILAGVASLVLATWGGTLLRAALLPRVHPIGPALDWRVVSFSMACAFSASLVAAMVPASLASRPTLVEALKSGVRDGPVAKSRFRSALLATQAGLSVILLVGAGLFVESLRRVRAVDVGFDHRNLIVASAHFLDGKKHAERADGFSELAARIAEKPGVAGVARGTGAPLWSWFSGASLYVPGRDSAITTDATRADYIGVSPEYFTVTGTRITAGRGFLASDQRTSAPVMVVSATLADRMWPGENPLGRCVIPDARTNPCYTIVGIAQDAHEFRIVESPYSHFYLPLAQMPRGELPSALVVRVPNENRRELAREIERMLGATFPGASVRARSADDLLAPELRPWQLGAQLFTALGLLALTVAGVGVYSVVSFAARQRSHEMGVRVALGARTSDLVGVIVGRVMVVVTAGVAGGIVVALASGKFIASLLFGVSARDVTATASAALALLIVALAASMEPAWRASRVDPALILREE
jgi:predicted permease